MKRNELNFLGITIILLLNSYIGMVFYDYNFNIFILIKKLSIVILIFLSMNIICTKLNEIKKYIIQYISFMGLIIFLKQFYLSFFIVFISKFVRKYFKIKIVFWISVFLYSFILILNIFGFLEYNNIKYGVRKFENFEVFRHALGFVHPNTAMSLLIPIFSSLYYLYYPKYKKIVLGIILIISKIIFDLTYSRTTFLLLILFIILILIKDKYIKKLKYLFLFEGNLLVFLSFYLSFYYRNSVLNKLFSGRLWLFYYYLSNKEISLLGNEHIAEMFKSYPLDNVYLKTLFENGIIGFILLLILIMLIMYILFESNDYRAIRIFAIILIFGFMEGTALFYYFNIIYFIISDYLFKGKVVKRIKI